jgi:hypothetical protein
MKNSRLLLTGILLVVAALVVGVWLGLSVQEPAQQEKAADYQRAVYSPLHFKPAIDNATDAQCLACHREVLEEKPRVASPAGLRAEESKAWYQQLSTYAGAQESFHRRHLVTGLARDLMDLKCNYCHQGHDPRDEAPGTSATAPAQGDAAFTLRKQVNVETTCLRCHGAMPPFERMGLPGPWEEVKAKFKSNCLFCHLAQRTVRHQVSYLKPEAIEQAALKDGNVCYGCHGGRVWYRTTYAYPRHSWPGMPAVVPEWAQGRPMESEARYALKVTK